MHALESGLQITALNVLLWFGSLLMATESCVLRKNAHYV